MLLAPADRLETPRLVLRPWAVVDAPRLKDALDANAGHLRGRIPVAVAQPGSLDAIVERIQGYEQSFATGAEWLFAILARDDARLIGGIGLYPRIGPGAIEIGYWAQAHETGRGYVTEAARALTIAAFASPDIERVEIRCPPANVASAAVAKRLGYVHVATLTTIPLSPLDAPRDMMVWELSRDAFTASSSA